jgi:aminomethyltransferase
VSQAPAEPLLRTPLFAAQQRLGARMVEFGGWQMPVQFSGILDEHRAVRTAVGVFDISHMGRFFAFGPEAAGNLQHLLTNDLNRLADGRAHYTLLCREDGGVLDDLVAYRRAGDDFLLVVNASNRAHDLAWMNGHRLGGAELTDLTFEQAMLAVQGPAAAPTLARLDAAPAAALPRWGCADLRVAGVPCFVARTGYTGEDGFELICAADRVEAVWSALLYAGAKPCGLGARDTLRLEAALALYGHELTEETNPMEAGLGWTVALEKGEFIGRAAIARVKAEGPARKLAGFELVERGIARAGHVVLHEGEPVGAVTSGAPSPTLGKSIGLAYLPTGLSSLGTAITIQIRDRPAAARVIRTPFYRAPAPA